MDIETDVVVDQVVSTPSNPTNPITDPQSQIDTPDAKEATPEKEHENAPIPKGVQKRIDRAVRQKYEAEARAKMLEERLSAVEARQHIPPTTRQADSSEPTIDQFDNFDAYVAAKAKWIAADTIRQTLSEREKQQQAAYEAAERTKTADSWTKRIAAATVEMPDFEDVLASSDVPMTPPMQQAIMESDVGPKLAYYLANHPDEATDIASMSPIGAIRALGRLEERLATAKSVVKTTNTPAPISKLGARAVVGKDPGKMSDAEYEKWRRSGRSA